MALHAGTGTKASYDGYEQDRRSWADWIKSLGNGIISLIKSLGNGIKSLAKGHRASAGQDDRRSWFDYLKSLGNGIKSLVKSFVNGIISFLFALSKWLFIGQLIAIIQRVGGLVGLTMNLNGEDKEDILSFILCECRCGPPPRPMVQVKLRAYTHTSCAISWQLARVRCM
jgi:hypothetical protein